MQEFQAMLPARLRFAVQLLIEVAAAGMFALMAVASVVSISQKGLTPTVLTEIDRCLKSHELIKVRLYGVERETRAALAAECSLHRPCSANRNISSLSPLMSKCRLRHRLKLGCAAERRQNKRHTAMHRDWERTRVLVRAYEALQQHLNAEPHVVISDHVSQMRLGVRLGNTDDAFDVMHRDGNAAALIGKSTHFGVQVYHSFRIHVGYFWFESFLGKSNVFLQNILRKRIVCCQHGRYIIICCIVL
jgi:hypothetical protein